MRILRIILVFLAIPLMILSATACSTAGSQSNAQIQTTPVTRGNLELKVNGSGKIAITNYANLSFGSGGKLETLNVKEGDAVTEGEVLAQLDTSGLEVQLAQAKAGLDQANLAKTQAETALTSAQFNLDRTQAVSDIKDAITTLQNKMTAAQVSLNQAIGSNDTTAINTMTAYITSIQGELYTQQQKLQTLLNQPEYAGVLTYNIFGETYDRLTVEDVHLKELAVESAQQTVNQASDNIDQAQKNIDFIQSQINDDTITAPFAGLVAALNYKQGDIIPPPSISPQVIIYLVEAKDLEADINVDEMDIQSVHVGQKATINVDAFPGTTLEGDVFYVPTVPNAQAAAAGATVYTVKISFTVPQGMDIKAGMNAGASIITDEKDNVLLLPNQAITTDSQGKTVVRIMSNQKMETQPVVTGISDRSRTEIVSGLQEGEKVVVPATGIEWSLQ